LCIARAKLFKSVERRNFAISPVTLSILIA
jgi:hypothetical protein